jgi:hypothetical protein
MLFWAQPLMNKPMKAKNKAVFLINLIRFPYFWPAFGKVMDLLPNKERPQLGFDDTERWIFRT